MARILVVGDVMVDAYIDADQAGTCVEAPHAPKLWQSDHHYTAGGAANAAACLRALGHDVRLLGLVGRDRAAHRLEVALVRRGIPLDLVRDPDRRTTVKTRIHAGGQMVCRVDDESLAPPSPAVHRELVGALKLLIFEHSPEAIVVSDYGKGMLRGLEQEILYQALLNLIPVFVDPAPGYVDAWAGAELLKLNRLEAQQVVGHDIVDRAAALSAAREVRRFAQCLAVVVTLGEQGSVAYEDDMNAWIQPGVATEVRALQGAGDAYLAGLVTGVLRGESLGAAMARGAGAASSAIAQVGTAVPQE